MSTALTLRQEQKRAANVRYRALRRALITAAKDVPCIECGIKYHPRAMDMHHPLGVKKLTGGSSMMTWAVRASLAELESELAKCTAMCANCHRIHHWGHTT